MPQSTLDAYDEGSPFAQRDGLVHHPLVREGALEAREYQTRLAELAVEGSLLVVLPTGLGKTAIALLAAAERLRREPGAQALVVAPTRPLVRQHAGALRDALALRPESVVELTGDVSPAGRAVAFAAARVVVATPHGLAHDVEAGRVDLSRVALLVVDEAHRAVGDYPYVPLAKAYLAQRAEPRILGLTASPGSRRERVDAVLEALGRPRVEARARGDEDVRPFVKDLRVLFREVALPEPARAARAELERVLAERLRKLRPFIPRRNVDARIGKGLLMETGDIIRKRLHGARGASKGFFFAAMLNHGVAIQAAHALELLETQGMAPFRMYVERAAGREDPSRAQATFLRDPRVQRALQIARSAGVSHPKENALLEAVRMQLEESPGSLVLVFAQYRDTVRVLLERLRRAGVAAERFVGQADKGAEDPGLTQEEQAALLRRFAEGGVRVLVATSVAEEGLHVPAVDLVVFYEPIPSEIRTIQRRGRTGRSRVGRVLVLVTRDSRDEAARRAEAEREAEMHRLVDALRDATA